MITATFVASTKVREQPSRSGTVLRIAQAGTVAYILDAVPVKADDHIWWRMVHNDETVGWSAQSTAGVDLLKLGYEKFEIAVAFTIFQEGGFQNNREDAGNWTGGEVGVGQLKGTKYGISAASYPSLDIFNLTEAQAKNIYYRDYWLTIQAYSYDYPKYLFLFDVGVISGIGRARDLVKFSPVRILYSQYLFYVNSKRFNLFGAGWIRRNTALLGMLD